METTRTRFMANINWGILAFALLAGLASVVLLAVHIWPGIFKGDGNLMLAARFWSLQFFVSIWAILIFSQKDALRNLPANRVGWLVLGAVAVAASFASLMYWSGFWAAGLRDIFSEWAGRAPYAPWFEPFLRPETLWILSAVGLGWGVLGAKTKVWPLCLFAFLHSLALLLSMGLILGLAFSLNEQAFFTPTVRFLSYVGGVYGLWLGLGFVFLRAVRR